MSSHVTQETGRVTMPVETGTPPGIPDVARYPSRRQRVIRSIRTASTPARFLALLLVLFLFKGILISLVFPPYSGHDEVAHYAYLKIMADDHRVPLIPDPYEFDREYRKDDTYSDWDMIPDEFYKYAHDEGGIGNYTTKDWWGGYAEPVRAVTFDGMYLPSGWVYTGNHPPLFYVFMVPVFKLVQHLDIDTQIYFFRMATIPFGLLTVLFSYLTVRTIFPRDRFLAMTVPAFVAFQPQIAYESAMLNNDILAIMFTSAVIWMLAVGLKQRFPIWNVLLIGLFFGLAMLSKSTAVTTGVLIAFAMILGLGVRNIREWVAKGALSALIAGLLVWPWLLYMWSTYGDLTALNRISFLQKWWNEQGGQHRTIWSMLSNRWFFWARWEETWGAFGWRLIQLDTNNATLLRVLLWLTLFATVGLAIYALRFLREHRRGTDSPSDRPVDATLALAPWQVTALLTMGLTCVVAYYAILQFGTTFSLTQARYYFPAIIPAALLCMLGVRSWVPRRWLSVAGAATFLGLVLLNLLIFTAYVIPYWNPTV
ncbi:MAG TPA: hypothetical protein VNZ58_00975 [Thermomicrobiales bacterium]|nr:hypothetical protein [Thermomicrobiales bacterium]